MTEGLAFALLALALVGWLALPLLPALRELLHPTDATPLAMVGQDAGELTYFADRFRAYLDGQLAQGGAVDGAHAGTLPDGTRWVAVASDANGSPAAANGARAVVDALVLAEPGARLPARAAYTMEVFARGDLTCGEDTVLRALLADGACELGAGADVLRWVHAEGALRVGEDATLHGRATSADSIELAAGVRFARLRAPRIAARADGPGLPAPASPAAREPAAPLAPFTPPGAVALGEGFLRIDGSLVVPPRVRVAANLVVRGDVHVGDGARLDGAVKAHGSITLGRDVSVEGALVARREVHVGRNARLASAVIAEECIHLAAHCRIGSAERPATVVAPVVCLEPHAVVHGAINAGDGLVLHEEHPARAVAAAA